MARFWKVDAALQGHVQDGKETRWLNIYHIDEVRDAGTYTPRDKNGKDLTDEQGNLIKIPFCTVYMHHEPYARQHSGHSTYTSFDVEMTGDAAVAHLEKMLLEDRMLSTAPHEHEDEDEHEDAPPAPKQLGYAFAESNASVLAAAVADLDDFDEIELSGRAAKTIKAALAVSKPFAVRFARSAIPINTNPVSQPYAVLTVPDAGNINVSRSTDARTLYFLGADEVQAFGIAILGHGQKVAQ